MSDATRTAPTHKDQAASQHSDEDGGSFSHLLPLAGMSDTRFERWTLLVLKPLGRWFSAAECEMGLDAYHSTAAKPARKRKSAPKVAMSTTAIRRAAGAIAKLRKPPEPEPRKIAKPKPPKPKPPKPPKPPKQTAEGKRATMLKATATYRAKKRAKIEAAFRKLLDQQIRDAPMVATIVGINDQMIRTSRALYVGTQVLFPGNIGATKGCVQILKDAGFSRAEAHDKNIKGSVHVWRRYEKP